MNKIIKKLPGHYDYDHVEWKKHGVIVGKGYITRDNKTKIIKCPECLLENYGPSVSSGRCAWCGYRDE